MRLDKFLAHAGVVSRRHAKQLVWEGRVTVNGVVPETPGAAVDPTKDAICVDGQPVRLVQHFVYLALHKPRGVLSTAQDDRGRPTVLDRIPKRFGRVYPVGRLDQDSEGLLLLTNDGELTYRLIHPRYGVEKTYHVWIRGRLREDDLERLRRGVKLEEGQTAPAKVRVIQRNRQGMKLEFVLHEGRKRQIRRMCRAVGCSVTRLVRVRFGPIALGDLPPGQWRKLEQDEIRRLKRAVGLQPA